MNNPKAKGGNVAEVFSLKDDDIIRVEAKFKGIKRWRIFRNFPPFLTYTRPELILNLELLKKVQYKITDISIDCIHEKTSSDPMGRTNYGTYIKSIHPSGEGIYEISLPPLLESNINYTYEIIVHLEGDDNGKIFDMTRQGIIMSTGIVLDRGAFYGNVFHIVLTAVVAAVTALVINHC